MEILTSTFSIFTFVLLALTAIALLLANMITSLERRLIASTALLLAGLFFLARATGPLMLTVGALGWATGLLLFLRAGMRWSRRRASRVGPLAALFLLPPALVGAFMLCGLILSTLAGPARLLARVIG